MASQYKRISELWDSQLTAFPVTKEQSEREVAEGGHSILSAAIDDVDEEDPEDEEGL